MNRWLLGGAMILSLLLAQVSLGICAWGYLTHVYRMPLGIAIMFGVMGAAVSAVVFWMAGTVVWMLRNNEV